MLPQNMRINKILKFHMKITFTACYYTLCRCGWPIAEVSGTADYSCIGKRCYKAPIIAEELQNASSPF